MDQTDPLASLSDKTLTERAQRGDIAAFDAIVERYAPQLYRLVARSIRRRSDCEDVVQESLIAAWKALPGFASRSTLKTWLYAIASRKTADALRRRNVICDTDAVGDMPTAEPGPFNRAADRDFLTAVSRELSHLPYRSRTAWWLREVDGMSIAEIATVLRTSEGVVRGHLQRTRHRLAAALDGYRPQ